MMDGYVGEPEENHISYEDGYFKQGLKDPLEVPDVRCD